MQMHEIHSEQRQTAGQALLKNSAILQAEGADAATFLQGQFSQDIIKLQNKEACFAGLSNPKGRLIASAYIYKKSAECFYIVIPNPMLAEVQKQLSKYVMRSKVKFSQQDALKLYGIWNTELNNFDDYFRLSEHANLYIGITKNKVTTDLKDETSWTLQKILHVIPEVNPETQEHFVAQMLNMDLLNGISFNKGCYTGQEIIARMQHLGRIKRRTLLLETDKLYSASEKITHAEKTIGEVVNCIKIEEQAFALAVIQIDKLSDIDNETLYKKSGFKVFEPAYALEQSV